MGPNAKRQTPPFSTYNFQPNNNITVEFTILLHITTPHERILFYYFIRFESYSAPRQHEFLYITRKVAYMYVPMYAYSLETFQLQLRSWCVYNMTIWAQ